MDIKPIRTEAEYDSALKEIERLWGSTYGTLPGDKLDVLVTLVEAYEEQHYPVPPPDPIEAIIHHMESQGLSRQDLQPYLGSRSHVEDVLSRKRPLSLDMIRRLQSGLGISADVLVQPYELERAS